MQSKPPKKPHGRANVFGSSRAGSDFRWTFNSATVPVSAELIEWADIIFVMEKSHRNKISKKFKLNLKNKRVICLDIPDEYEYMDQELVTLLEVRVGHFIKDA